MRLQSCDVACSRARPCAFAARIVACAQPSFNTNRRDRLINEDNRMPTNTVTLSVAPIYNLIARALVALAAPSSFGQPASRSASCVARRLSATFVVVAMVAAKLVIFGVAAAALLLFAGIEVANAAYTFKSGRCSRNQALMSSNQRRVAATCQIENLTDSKVGRLMSIVRKYLI